MTEVGVALALRRQKQLIHGGGSAAKLDADVRGSARSIADNDRTNHLQPKRSSSSVGSVNSEVDATNRRRKIKKKTIPSKRKRNPSVQVLIDAVTIYVLCVYLPDVIKFIIHAYRMSWREGGTLLRTSERMCSSSPVLEYLLFRAGNETSVGTDEDSTNSDGSSLLDALAPDTGFGDVGIVALISLSMAVLRIALVHFCVPRYLEQPQRLEALVRCKSVHLLSASYSGTVTPRQSFSQSREMKINGDVATLLPPMPILLASHDREETKSEDNTLVIPLDPYDSDRVPLAPRSFNSHDDADADEKDYDDLAASLGDDGWLLPGEGAELEPAPAVSSGLISSTSAQSLQVLLQQATPVRAMPNIPKSPTPSKPQKMDRLFAAPKYATAMFRLLYCSGCVIIALAYFLDAEFWPPAVGGRGSTKNCWDLSSLGTVIMDSDFDKHNTVLRRYFLLQASYHFHSAAFHIVVSILLWTVSKSVKRKNGNNHTGQESTRGHLLLGVIPSNLVNMQSFFLHCIAVAVIAAAYLFSSLRRLAAIGMFAFDVSSWFLHLLQLCINSPPGRVSPTWVWALHRLLVLPTFLYSRFYVFPFVLGYSSMMESGTWLRQLESVTVPGVSKGMRILFFSWLSVLMLMNIVHVRRLISHSHVLQRIVTRQEATSESQRTRKGSQAKTD